MTIYAKDINTTTAPMGEKLIEDMTKATSRDPAAFTDVALSQMTLVQAVNSATPEMNLEFKKVVAKLEAGGTLVDLYASLLSLEEKALLKYAYGL